MNGALIFAVHLILILMLYYYPMKVLAEPFAEAQTNGLKIVLHTEQCALKEVSNLPRRATWHQEAKIYEGCWGISPQFNIIVAYFEDKTVYSIPANFFSRVRPT